MIKSPNIGCERKGIGRTVSSLVAWGKLPPDVKGAIVEVHGEPKIGHPPSGLKERIKPDIVAAAYYSTVMTTKGALLPAKQQEYTANAQVMNAILLAQDTEKQARAKHGVNKSDFWTRASDAVNGLPKDTGHKLPKNARALKRKCDEYRAARKRSAEEGYALLVHGGVGSQNALKVTHTMEQLIVSIAVMPERPFTSTVWEYLAMFLAGHMEVCDARTGEVIDHTQFCDAQGNAITVSEATVWNYIKKNDTLIGSLTMGKHRFIGAHKPYHHRHAPEWVFSKVTMDDRDLSRLMDDGKRVKAYYTYDVCSGAVIGRSYSRSKDEALFIDCLRDMLRFIDAGRYGGIPAEVEVEHHLVRKFKDDLELIFPRVRWCNPGNSQEKSAEHFNRSKKFTVEKRNHAGIGRWWARYSRYQVDEDKVNDEFVGKRFSYETLVADDMEDIGQYNAQLHPNQKKYPGMSRMDVLEANMSPELMPLSRPAIMHMIGNLTPTSINRLELRANHGHYRLPNGLKDMDMLRPGDITVDAYWLPDNNGEVNEVHVYQHGRYLFTAPKIETYNRAKAEWKDADSDSYAAQAEYVGRFDAEVKAKGKEVMKVAVIKADRMVTNVEPAEVMPEPVRPEPMAQSFKRSLKDRY
ncbi:MAG: hypothetical protein Q8L89_04260 [Gammaproteobacteria bacterium]|nr:hypothetical protein [Gammaproteobacteria bacterium]